MMSLPSSFDTHTSGTLTLPVHWSRHAGDADEAGKVRTGNER